MEKLKTCFRWSSGKDSSLALYYLLQNKRYSVQQLLTTINLPYKRISMHGLRKKLLLEQANALGVPLNIIELPEKPSMEEYEKIMRKQIFTLKQNNFTRMAFGDIFLEDLKKFREDQMQAYNVKTIFPLWRRNTLELINEFITLGFKAIVVCINSTLLNQSFLGRIIDQDFIKDLPPDVDVCGENGEFHTFCFDGPIFKTPVVFKTGETIYKEYQTPGDTNSHTGFWFYDLLSVNEK